MAAETLGAIALLDPAIKLGRKVWKTYKLQKSFGKDFKDYSNHFFNEGVLLDELLRTPINLLTDDVTRSELNVVLEVGSAQDLELAQLLQRKPDEYLKARQILSTLANLSSLFEECSNLIDSYIPPVTAPATPRNASPVEAHNSRNATPSPTRTDGASNSTPDTSHSSSQANLNLVPQDVEKSKGFLRRIMPKRKKSKVPMRSAAPDTLQLPVVQQQASIEDAQAQAMQEGVGVLKRIKDWVPHDAERFRATIHRIQESNRFLERLATISDIRQRSEQLVAPVSTNMIVAPTEDGSAQFLLALGEIFTASSRPNEHTFFTLGLKDNYKVYAEESQRRSAYLQLDPNSCLFPVKACSTPAVSHEGTSAEILIAVTQAAELNTFSEAQTASPSRLEFVFNHSGDPLTPGQYYKDRAPFHFKRHKFKIFQHYPASSSNVALITDMLNDTRLRQEKELVGFRSHLAYSIAAFFSNAFEAQISISSHDLLFFFNRLPSLIDPEDLVIDLTSPYLKSIDCAHTGAGSLHGAQVNTPGSVVQKLGILLHEIGSWTPIWPAGEARPKLDKAVGIAKRDAPKSRSALGLGYYNVLQDCLDWQEHFRAETFQEKVVTPLQILKSKHQLPTDEVY
ncbi:hypothetical protein MMC06_000528 [Schaereria dolodes]|nr:hypothetical protein [Schaereria dolodes]